MENPTKETLTLAAGKPTLFCKGHMRRRGLVACNSKKPCGHAVPSPRLAHKAGPGPPGQHRAASCWGHGPRRRAPCFVDTGPSCGDRGFPGEGRGHSPAAYFRVNVQQGASNQVAGRGAEDGCCVEDGWKRSRAIRGLPHGSVCDTQAPRESLASQRDRALGGVRLRPSPRGRRG